MKVRVEDVFDAATALPGHDRCNGLHGHTYKVEAIVDGPLVGGVVADFRVLKARLSEVIKPFDHTDVSLQFTYPSCETLIIDICKRLKPVMPGLEMVRLWEGEGKWIELDAADLESLQP